MDFQQAGLEVIHAAKKEGLDHVDALIERTEELEVQIRDNKVEKVEQSTSLGLGIRVLNQGLQIRFLLRTLVTNMCEPCPQGCSEPCHHGNRVY